MKRPTKITLIIVAALLSAVAIVRYNDNGPPPSASAYITSTEPHKKIEDSIQNGSLLSATPVDNEDTRKVSIPDELKRATDDPAVADFFNRHNIDKEEVGEVKDTANRTQQLYVNGKLVFEAPQILRRRSVASNGTIVFTVVIDAKTGVKKAEWEEDKMSSIWMIDASGVKKQISPQQIKADCPLISPDGKRVAFSGNVVTSDGNEGPMILFVFDLEASQYRKYISPEKQDSYTVGAAEWSSDSKVLHVIENHGETGGNMVMKSIQL